MYRVRKQSDGTLAVYDGPHYCGCVECDGATFAASKGDETEQAKFTNQGDAIGWIVAEFRGVPWADRPAARRVSEEPYNPT